MLGDQEQVRVQYRHESELGSSLRDDGDRGPRVLILIENSDFPGDVRVRKEAKSLRESGYVVSVICPALPEEPLKESLWDVDVRRYRPLLARGGAVSQGLEYLTALIKTLWIMIKLLRSPGFDAIQACNPPDLFFLIAWPFKLAGKRFIFDQHDLAPELYSTLYCRDRGLVMRFMRWSERMSYALSDVVIVCNESYRRLALSRGGVESDRVFTVRNGPSDGWPQPMSPDLSLKKGRRFLVAYIGVMGYQDGLDVLLEVVHTLVHTMGFRDATFGLIGDGSAVESLREQARHLGVEDFVDFTGWIKEDGRLSTYLATADACVCPEPSSPLNDHSTFIKVMEYMASGTPIVAFDLRETRVSAQEAAVYAAPGDVEAFARLIKEVLSDEVLRLKMVASAAERIPSLRWETQIPNLLAAYEYTLSRGTQTKMTRMLDT